MNYTYEYPRPAVAADSAVFSVAGEHLRILLIQRKHEPFQGSWALPGGFVEKDEDIDVAAKRELFEETALQGIDLEQFRSFGKPGRDPRGHTITVVYAGFAEPESDTAVAGDDAARAQWFEINKLPELAFDHNDVISEVFEWLIDRLKRHSSVWSDASRDVALRCLENIKEN